MSEKRQCFLIKIPHSGKQSAVEMENFLADLHRQLLSLPNINQQQDISLELAVIKQFVHFFIVTHPDSSELVLSQLYANFTDIEVEEVQDYTQQVSDQQFVAACELKLEKKDLYPLKTYPEMEQDSLLGLSGIFSKIKETEQFWLHIILQPVADSWYQEGRRYLKRAIRWQLEPTKAKAAMELKFEKLFFKSKIKLAYIAAHQTTADQRLSAAVKSFDRFDNGVINGLEGTKFIKGSEAHRWFSSRELTKRQYQLNTEELASIYHFPSKKVPIANVVRVLSHKAEPPPNLPKAELFEDKTISSFALTNFRNHHHPFGLRREDRRRHLYVIGKTGMGKSKLLEILMLSDIYDNKGFVLLDPHGDLAEEILRMIPQERIKDVIYFNPADEEYPIGFNPLEAMDRAYWQQTVTGFISIFKKLFAFDWTPRLEHMLRYTTLALLETQNATVVGIVKLLTNKNYRQEVIAQIQDPVVKNFWTHEFASWNEKFDNEAIVPLLNKVGEFISSPLIRNCLGQNKSSFTIREVMEQNKILILNLASGRLGEENSSLLGSMVVTQIQQAAMARARLPEAERQDFYLYVDEFQNFATDAFATILSEARKYRLCLAMANQYLGQLNENIQKTVFGNIGSLISFRLGSSDAEQLQTELSPIFTAEDMMNLDARHMNIKLSINGQTAPPFSAQTITLPQIQTDHSWEIIQHSRQTYGRPRAQVEAEIDAWEKDTPSPTTNISQPINTTQPIYKPVTVIDNSAQKPTFEPPII